MRNWIDSVADSQDIVICSSVQLARNIKDNLFTDKLRVDIARKNVDDIYEILNENCENEEFQLIKLWEQEYNYVKGFIEKNFITKKLLDRKDKGAFIINEENTLSVMVNEEDHIIIKSISDGLNLLEEYKYVDRIDDIIEEKITYSFHEELGYLTASPKKVGTALKVTVLIHLPALRYNNEIGELAKKLKENNIEITSMYKDKEDCGNMYLVSNAVALGLSEENIISNIQDAVYKLISEEKKTREILITKYKYEIEDKIFRSISIMENARILNSKEVIEFLSYIRLGVEMSLLNIEKKKINKMLIETRDAIIEGKLGINSSLRDKNIERAKVVREILKED